MGKREVIIADVSRKYETPVAELVQVACQFRSTLFLNTKTHKINAKSIMGVMAFNPTEGMKVEVTAEGEDETAALDAVENFLLCR